MKFLSYGDPIPKLKIEVENRKYTTYIFLQFSKT